MFSVLPHWIRVDDQRKKWQKNEKFKISSLFSRDRCVHGAKKNFLIAWARRIGSFPRVGRLGKNFNTFGTPGYAWIAIWIWRWDMEMDAVAHPPDKKREKKGARKSDPLKNINTFNILEKHRFSVFLNIGNYYEINTC